MDDLTHSQHIILIGLMGCGKTTIGRELSKATGHPLIDMDSLIEEQIGKSIAQIFQEEGEAHFRSLETALLRYLLEERPQTAGGCIISTGGGIVVRPENHEILRQLGYCVWLDVPVDTLVTRTERCQNRPLLQDKAKLEQTLLALREQRAPLYQKLSQLRLDSSTLEIHEAVQTILKAQQNHYKQVSEKRTAPTAKKLTRKDYLAKKLRKKIQKRK